MLEKENLDGFIFPVSLHEKREKMVNPKSVEYVQTLLKIQAHVPECIDAKKAREIFHTLRTKIDWSDREGLPQFNNFVSQFPELSKYIDEQVERLRKTYSIPTSRMATIVTFLPNGSYDVWDHYHPGQCEVKFSFGDSRPVIVNGTEYMMNAGDVVVFGPLHHSVPLHENAGEQINIVTYFTDEAHNINL